MATEPIHLRFIACPLCKHQYMWAGHRLPSFCPECGKQMIEHMQKGAGIIVSDPNASLRYDPAANSDTNIHATIAAYERTPAIKQKGEERPRRSAIKRSRARVE